MNKKKIKERDLGKMNKIKLITFGAEEQEIKEIVETAHKKAIRLGVIMSSSYKVETKDES